MSLCWCGHEATSHGPTCRLAEVHKLMELTSNRTTRRLGVRIEAAILNGEPTVRLPHPSEIGASVGRARPVREMLEMLRTWVEIDQRSVVVVGAMRPQDADLIRDLCSALDSVALLVERDDPKACEILTKANDLYSRAQEALDG